MSEVSFMSELLGGLFMFAVMFGPAILWDLFTGGR